MRKVPVVSLQVDPDNVLEKEGIGICSGNFEQLVKDTHKLITDDSLRNQMGNKARAYAIKNHSLKNMDKIIDLMVR
jgi:glycosyltransferase involved in cell wall biosynthesis